ncbi:hypothetical protein F7734_10185 [Scytonema sp. UIC 10036]|uniref:hypothetical protein n=1 Tax=Scytonema sp. UIC 10036 TaxID=2304196 RepID=UPI0012DA4E32|nr:hypothetical protein [Scytonema sp. UIC 10036]MUG92799.1 hypothetical protein [Scytonema sp. UIC 10036]
MSSSLNERAVYFCPDERGLVCWRVTNNGASEITNHPQVEELSLHEEYKFKIPGAGMIYLASLDFGIELSESWLIAPESEDNDKLAVNAKLGGLMPSDIWLNRFKPGMHEIRQITVPQIEFLEGYRAPNNNN